MSIIIVILFFISQPIFPIASDHQYPPALANKDKLNSHVITLSAKIIANTPIAHLLDKKAEYIFSRLSAYSTNVSYQYYDVMGVTHKNIALDIKGTKNTCKTYVIGAHYDSYDNLPGADDNSSGVAGLIELARLFTQSKPLCDIQLVAYTLEEPPYFRSEHMGSYIHAKSLKDQDKDLAFMLSLEMIGYFSDAADSQDYPIKGMHMLYSDKGDFISIVSNTSPIMLTRFLKKAIRKATELPVYSINAPTMIAGIDFSDHLNYWQFDFPALMITDTSFKRNKNYHTEFDTAEKLDYHRMAKVVDGVYYAVLEHMQN
jgi:Zn-dependent M28 family amino/carboxypeptidase